MQTCQYVAEQDLSQIERWVESTACDVSAMREIT